MSAVRKVEACPHCADMAEELTELRRQLLWELDEQRPLALKTKLGLTMGEARLMSALYAARPRIVSPGALVSACASESSEAPEKIVRVYVSRLRRLMGHDIISSVHGQGYGLAPAGIAKIAAALA